MSDFSSCVIPSGITKGCRDRIGGINTIYFASLADKSTLTYASTLITTFTLSTGKMFRTFEVEQGTATASDDINPNAPNGSLFFEHKLTALFAKRTANISHIIKILAQQDLMAIILDQNGEYWLLGGTRGLKMQPSTSPFGTAMGDMNGYNLVFLGQETIQALQVPSNLIATLTAAAV